MAQGAGKKLGKAKASKYDVKVSDLELPGAPTRAEVAGLQLPGAPPPPTQPEVDTTSQATALQLPGARPQPPQAEVSPRPLTIVPAPAHLPPQADAVWFRSLLEALRLRFPGPVVARIFEAFQGAWASVHGWWSGPPLAVASPELKKKKKKSKKKDKNKNTVLPVPRRSKAWLYWEKRRRVIPPPPALDEPPLKTNKDDEKTNKDDRQTKKDVPVIIDGVAVPAAIKERYKRYCRIAGSCPATTTVCHLCIFEEELHPNGIVRTSEMIMHCNIHHSVAVRCGRFGCAAKVPPGRALREHTYFCHDLPADWWRLP